MLSDRGISRSEAYALADWYATHEAEVDMPAGVLAFGYRWHAWHQPSGYRSLVLNGDTYRLHVPALVLVVANQNAYAFALQGDARPDEGTLLFVAPFPGLGRHGWVPGWRSETLETALIDGIADVMRAFDHCALMAVDNDWEPPCKHPMGVEKLWVEMIQRRWKRFPIKYLRRTPYTVGSLVEQVRAGHPFSMDPGEEPERVSQAEQATPS